MGNKSLVVPLHIGRGGFKQCGVREQNPSAALIGTGVAIDVDEILIGKVFLYWNALGEGPPQVECTL